MTPSDSKTISSEFVIYSFEKDALSKGSPVWQKRDSFAREEIAVEQARLLYNTSRFTRIEVRHRERDALNGNWSDKAVQVFDTAPAKIKNAVWLMCAAASCILAAGVIAVYYQ